MFVSDSFPAGLNLLFGDCSKRAPESDVEDTDHGIGPESLLGR